MRLCATYNAKVNGSHAVPMNSTASKPGIRPRGHQCHSAMTLATSSGTSASHSQAYACISSSTRCTSNDAHIVASQPIGRHGR
ncbi:hypothetical protein D3C80_1845720 [compost metagenome]